MCQTIAVAMSGGVDSSAAALLLQREGHDLLGLTLRLFEPRGVDQASEDAANQSWGRWAPQCGHTVAGTRFSYRLIDPPRFRRPRTPTGRFPTPA